MVFGFLRRKKAAEPAEPAPEPLYTASPTEAVPIDSVLGGIDAISSSGLPRPGSRTEDAGSSRVFTPEELEPSASPYRNNGPVRPTIRQALKTVTWNDFRQLHKVPCLREGMLPGISSGIAIGAVMFSTGSSTLRAGHWAVGTFFGISSFLFVQCRQDRHRSMLATKLVEQTLRRQQQIQRTRVGDARPKEPAQLF
ncbi:uncharacterized protein V1510DRAFT_401863 [Dipodascopsis tothii]|uniref:uncharacterized protein n=1 Tax=Dipodascopsis tothii TaxID=44089 RepID=UPI0034CD8DF5